MCDILSDDWNDPFNGDLELFIDNYITPLGDPHPPINDQAFLQELDVVLRALRPPMGGYCRKRKGGGERSRRKRGKIVKQ